MKKLLGLLLIVLYITSCKRDSFMEESVGGNVSLMFNNNAGRMLVPVANNFSKSSEVITIPVTISLSGPAPKIFKVGMVSNVDTVKSLIANNSLTNTVALEANEFDLTKSIDIPYGATTFAGNLSIPTATIEKYYGKDIAIAVKLVDPTRGNTLIASKKTVIVVVKTTEVISQNEIHNIYFPKSGINLIPGNTSYTEEFSDYLIPFDVNLAGDVSEQFIVTQLTVNTDTITKLIAKNILPSNTVALSLSADDFSVFESVQINAKKTSATVNLRIRKAAMLKYLDKKVAVALTLTNPSRFKVQAANSTVIVLVTPNRLMTDITGFMKNTTRPFTASISPAPARWGKLTDWITNDAANNIIISGNRYGTFDNNNSTNIAMETGFNAVPNITDGKIYQTITLPAGSYRYETVLRTGTTQNAYAVAVAGATLPNTAQVSNTTTLANTKLTSGTVSIAFVLTQSTQVSLGYVATLTGNQSVNIQSVKLVNVF